MVSSETVNFRFPQALCEQGDAFIETGGAKSQSDLLISAVIEQIKADLLAIQQKQPFENRSGKLSSAAKKAAEQVLSARMHKTLLQNIDLLVEQGAAENRTAYVRRSYANKLARNRDHPKNPEELARIIVSTRVFKETVRALFQEEKQKIVDAIRKLFG